MPESTAAGVAVPSEAGMLDDDDAGLPNPSIRHLLLPKFLTMRARATVAEKGSTTRLIFLALIGLLFWLMAFGVLHRVLKYFRSVEEIGILLAGKLMGLILIGFFSILLLSNVIGALSTFFLARDLDMLVAAPVDWLRFYLSKLAETMAHSSWMVVLMSIPIFAAYGVAYDGGLMYPIVAVLVFIPFLVLPAIVGSVITLLLVNIFPARRTRDLLAVVAVLAGAGLAVLFRLVRPERLARPEEYESLVEFVAILRTPTSPFLPSEWAQGALMTFLTGNTGNYSFGFLMFLLWSTAASFIIIGSKLHGIFYPMGFTRAQESGGVVRHTRDGILTRFGMSAFGVFGTVRRELLMKEVRLFFRDTTQWSQLILLAVLVVVYVFNIRYLPLSGEGVSQILVNLIPFLNLGLTGFVISSVAARFIFPGVSLEGRTLWLLKSSPLQMRELLWSKFWVGTAPLLILALGISGLTNFFLGVGEFMFLASIFTISLLTIAIASLALGFGTLFPQYDTENAAQIPTSFGGLLFMMTSIVLIGAVIWISAGPVIAHANAQRDPTSVVDSTQLMISIGGVLLLCGAATLVPVRVALRRLETAER